ncbi:MAG: DUF3459 domain-containing protein [Sandaracinaceae bacterium]|nr:DUF3459 domain-containing protein [Sandaracinaceae bacterium]
MAPSNPNLPPRSPEDEPWWTRTSIYQVYPRSFADSNGDGIGDLPGVIAHLDHVADLGVDTLWVSPFFSSPQADFGYDVTDYCGVAPEYGTLEDVDALIAGAHQRGLKVMFDLVLNHTSDQHQWFVSSRSGKSGPKADWYIWHDGRSGGRRGRRPPNNWRSAMEVSSAWQWSPERQQWYLASFLPFQPDLNWRHPEVREAMFDAVRFWLRRGVDGFRLDIFGSIMKDPRWRDNPLEPSLGGGAIARIWKRKFTENTPDNVQLAKDLRAVCAEFGDPERVLLGEVFGDGATLRGFLGTPHEPGLHLVFLFDFLAYTYSAAFFRDRISEYERDYPAPLQPSYVLENHDRSRLMDRVGGDLDKARVLAVLLCTLRGVPTLYQGQEVGMPNTYLPLRTARDPIARTYFRWVPEVVSKRLAERINRDEVRTPMQWTAAENAGFTQPGVRPWLPLGKHVATRNVATQTGDPTSMLELYRSLLRLRRERPALHRGALQLVPAGEDVVAFTRSTSHDRHPGGDVFVAVNLGRSPVSVRVPMPAAQVLVTSNRAAALAGGTLTLPPDSGAVVG